MYKILRFYRDQPGLSNRTIKRGLTLEEAQAHCHDPETSSKTATLARARRRTYRYGPWFDGYTEDRS